MNTSSKNYASKSSARKALSRIMGKIGVFSGKDYASGKFINAEINGTTLTLKSTYWVESSLENFISGKDKL